MFSTKVKAPPLTGKDWLNVAGKLSLENLRGKIVLLDFWTFCCSDCMHLLPYLKQLEEQFPVELVVIGVHSGKFDNERDTNSIRNAMLRYGVKHPVINDRGYSVWEAYSIREWPTLVLIDPEGFVVQKVACSQGPAGKFEQTIADLIVEHKAGGTLNLQPLDFIVNETASESDLRFPESITAGSDRLIISDSGNHRLIVTDPDGTVRDVIGSGIAGSSDGSFDSCTFNTPRGAVVDGFHVYVADSENHLIRCADLHARTVTTIAGTGSQAAYLAQEKQGRALEIALSTPWDVLRWKDSLIIAMAGTHQLWCLDLVTRSLKLFAGSGVESLLDSDRLSARLSQPSGLSADNGKIYFIDSETSSLRLVNGDSKHAEVTTLIGTGLFDFGDKEGTFTESKLQHPLGIAAYGSRIFVADSYNHKIKEIDLEQRTCRTLSGAGKQGFEDGAPGLFSEPGGMVLLNDHLYVADTNNHAIRVLDLNKEEVRTLKLTGVPPTAQNHSKKLSWPNLTSRELPPATLAAGIKGELKIDLTLPSHLHLNEEMPIAYQLSRHKDIMLTDLETGEFTDLSYSIPFKTLPAETGVQQLELRLALYLCANEGACYVKSFQYNLPVELSSDSSHCTLQIQEVITSV